MKLEHLATDNYADWLFPFLNIIIKPDKLEKKLQRSIRCHRPHVTAYLVVCSLPPEEKTILLCWIFPMYEGEQKQGARRGVSEGGVYTWRGGGFQ